MSKSRDELQKKLAELEKRARAGESKAVEKQHAEGKLTARERIDKLLDPESFVEEFMLAETQVMDFGMAEKRRPGDGVAVRPVLVSHRRHSGDDG